MNTNTGSKAREVKVNVKKNESKQKKEYSMGCMVNLFENTGEGTWSSKLQFYIIFLYLFLSLSLDLAAIKPYLLSFEGRLFIWVF